MRILSSMNDPRMGGPQQRSLSIAKGLRKQGIHTEFIVPNGDSEFERVATEEGFNVHRPGLSRVKPPRDILGNIQYIVKLPTFIINILGVIQSRSIDIVHVNMSLNIEAAIAAWLSDAKLLWHFNDVLVPWPVRSVSATLAQRLSHKIAVASEGVRRYYFGNKVTDVDTLYAPVDTNKFDPNKAEDIDLSGKYAVNPNDTVIGMVANINPIKGHEYMIKSLPEIQQGVDDNTKLVIAGSVIESRNKYYQKLKDLRSDLELEKSVHFLGREDDIPSFLNSIDMFVLPSIAEACPIALLEAMAMKKPIVATNIGGVPELISHQKSGLIVPPKNPREIAKACTTLLTNAKLAEQYSARAQERAQSKFSRSACIKRHREIYCSLLE